MGEAKSVHRMNTRTLIYTIILGFLILWAFSEVGI